MAKFILYGDGINDDLPYIQNALDSGISELYLPAPKVNYLISGSIKINSNQTLRLAPTAIIKLKANSNCPMIRDVSYSEWAYNVCIDGGIWDMNNVNQEPNPWWVKGSDGKLQHERLGIPAGQTNKLIAPYLTEPINTYTGHCFMFCRIKNFTFKNLTIRNPVVFGFQAFYLENFTIENITFDYFATSFNFYNNDGIHLEGNCRNGVIRNLKGNCYDDMVALTADDGGCFGTIENVVIDGLYADRCHSAVRLLSHGEWVKNITIKNVFGGYYKYAIGITKYHGGPNERGVYSNIKIDNVHAHGCDSPRNPLTDLKGTKIALIWQQGYIDVDNLTITNCFREETETNRAFFCLEENATIGTLILDNITQKNLTDKELPFIEIKGEVKNLTKKDLFNI